MNMTPIEKQTKRAKRAFYAQQRGSWNGVKPVTRVAKSKKLYDRSRFREMVRDKASGNMV